MKRVARMPRTIQRSAPPSTAPPAAPRVTLRVDRRGYVYVGKVKIGQYVSERRALRVKDKSPGRGKRRGSQFVEVSVDEFPALETLSCKAQAGENDTQTVVDSGDL